MRAGSETAGMRTNRGVRTRALLIAAMAVVIAAATFASLLLIRHRLLEQVTQGLSANLARSVNTFQDLQAERLKALDRENALMADLPTLRSLMTTNDARTIENEAADYRNVSGSDLFALADMENHVVAAFTSGSQPDTQAAADLQALLEKPGTVYLVSGRRLYACSVRPLYFGSETKGALLGYVISGFVIDRELLEQISRATMVDSTFISNGQALASTLPEATQESLSQQLFSPAGPAARPIGPGDEKYLAVTTELSSHASAPLQLVVLRSFSAADRSIRQIDQLVVVAGLVAMVLGTLLMLALSYSVTRPLEQLAAGLRAFGSGDSAHLLPHRGTREVRDLSASFSKMRQQIQETNRALLESERLATIGRMASSVSHDLRHYLAAVYANAEFLASERLTDAERAEILSDIHAAVYGTTDLLESMLIFSRTGSAIRRSPEVMATLLERAVALVERHPDAANATLTARCNDAANTLAVVDVKQIERALYNLLLNACQSRRAPSDTVHVTARLELEGDEIHFEVTDDGAGVPEDIRTSLFQPFVSQGKQKGSGLGLTLAHCIAAEHGGYLVLVSSHPGETIFRMTIARGVLAEDAYPEKPEAEVTHEA